MKIFVNATAADSRGPLVVLKNFIQELSESEILNELNIDLDIYVSIDDLISNNTKIKIIKDFAKKSFRDKYYFEKKIIPKLIERNEYDAYFSMVNLGIKKCRIPQFIFIQSSMPFSNLPFKEYELKNFIKYKILMSLIYRWNIKKYECLFVQTQWMKDAVIEKYGYSNPIHVLKPYNSSIKICNQPLSDSLSSKLNNEKLIKLLYVTNSEKYKNNERLIESIHRVNRDGKKVRLFITLEGEDDADICYIGKVDYSSIYSLYQSVDALIFPSLLETLGLPLMEFMQLEKPILASDLPFSREICKDNAKYFNPLEISSICECIKNFVDISKEKKFDIHKLESSVSEGYTDFIRIIYEHIIKKKYAVDDLKV